MFPAINGSKNGFSRLDFLVILVVCGLLAVFMLLPRLARHGERAQRDHCMNNLKNIGLAYSIYANDHNGLFPWENLANQVGLDPVRHYQSISNDLVNPAVLVCPEDSRTPATDWLSLQQTNQVSYFLGINSSQKLPRSFLAGDRNLTLNGKPVSGVLQIRNDSALGYSKSIHPGWGNIVGADGGLAKLGSTQLRSDLRNSGLETNEVATLLIP